MTIYNNTKNNLTEEFVIVDTSKDIKDFACDTALEEIYRDDKYIYYVYCFDTTGVGIEGHALHRMNLDGSNEIIAAYEVSSDILKCSHFDYKIKKGWVYYKNFKMELGNPASGLEKIVMNDIGDNDWIYYITNQLIKAKKDGSQRVVLDGEDTFDYEIEKVEDNIKVNNI